MNLLLFEADHLKDDATLRVSGRQHQHLQKTLKTKIGDTVRVGAIDGLIGCATVTANSPETTTLKVLLDKQPPPALPIKLILALPRPKMMRRILQTIASLGIKELHLINSYRVDKSYWGTPWLQPLAVKEQLLLGLEQSGDTILPTVHLHKLFKPYVEDQLPDTIEGTHALLAHPYAATACTSGLVGEWVSLAIGPEGGFIPYEVEKLQDCGFLPVSLGPRILRVETAIPVLVTKVAG